MMNAETADRRAMLRAKLREHFDGRIVRKDLTLSLIHIDVYKRQVICLAWWSIAGKILEC